MNFSSKDQAEKSADPAEQNVHEQNKVDEDDDALSNNAVPNKSQ